MTDMEKNKGQEGQRGVADSSNSDAFVLEKNIFSNIFEKDIRRVYIYKKAERLARALHMVTPAFLSSPALRNRADVIAIAIVDAATLPPGQARAALARELLALSSVLSIAHTSGMLSSMNAELIGKEARLLLQEIAEYQEPRLFMEEAPTLAELAKSTQGMTAQRSLMSAPRQAPRAPAPAGLKGQGQPIKDKSESSGTDSRREAILSILKEKGPSSIKDISTMVRGVSEKTIQRELQALVTEGSLSKTGERRWTTYTLVS